ncbi:MAG: GHKL domain-containing protein [Clostridiales bacterium]|nr:GHKL domain-containing protein [Clostridiales bacterium]MDD6492337.1 GHKL domain-containing protein [Bacillota bacterium]
MNLHWFIYSSITVLYINSVLTNMCYMKLKFSQRVTVYLYSLAVTFFMPMAHGTWTNIIVIIGSYLLVCWWQKHALLNGIGMMLNYIIGVSINYIVLAGIYMCGFNIQRISSNMLYYFLYCFGLTVILQLVTGILGKYCRNVIWKWLEEKDTNQRKIVYLLFAEIGICCTVFAFNVIWGNYVGYSTSILMFNGGLFLILLFATGIVLYRLYVILKEDYALRLRISEAEAMVEYASRLENLYQEIRIFKHDYMNILSSMYSYLDEGKYEELKKYFEKEILPSGRHLAIEDAAIGQLANMKILEIKSVLYAKILKATCLELQIVVDIPKEVVTLNILIPDLVRILGILLDNAIEAALETEEQKLYIGIIEEKEQGYIKVSNSSKPVENISLLFEQGYTSKQKHIGVGLYEVEKLLKDKEEVFLNTEYKEGEFVQLLQIIKKEENN